MRHLSRNVLLDLVDGTIAAAAEVPAREHLACCRECAALYRAQQDVRGALRAAQAPLPGNDLMAGLMSLGTGNRLGQGAVLPPAAPPSLGGGTVGLPEESRRQDPARWVFTAALAGGVSLAALGGGTSLAAASGTQLPSARTVLSGLSSNPMQAWVSVDRKGHH